MKLLLLAALPLVIFLSGCENTNGNGGPRADIHGDAGVGYESRNMSGVAPTRPVN